MLLYSPGGLERTLLPGDFDLAQISWRPDYDPFFYQELSWAPAAIGLPCPSALGIRPVDQQTAQVKAFFCNEAYGQCVHSCGGVMDSEYRFRARAEWTADRRGRVAGDPLAPGLDFAAPPEFQGVPGVWSPEHFFVAAVATCFITTFRAIAEFSKFKFDGLTVTGEGVLEKGEGGYKFTRIFLQPVLTIEREEDRERAQRLLEKAERSCLISRSIHSEIVLQSTVGVGRAVSRS